jgi:glycosyltransferase involved in cell wall biosynthesis
MTNLRIALIHNSSPLEGGSYTYESNISKYLKDRLPSNYELVDFYKGGKNKVSKRLNTYRVASFQIFLAMLRQSALGLQILKTLNLDKSRFEKFLLSNKFDFVYFLSPNPSALAISNIPMLNTVWDLGHRHYPEFEEFSFGGRFQKREYFYNNVLNRSAHVIVDGEKTKSELVAYYGVQEARVTPLGLFPCKFPHTCSESCIEDQYVFYPAQFWGHKNHEVLVEAFSLLKPSKPNLKLIFSGADKGEMEKIKRLVNRLGLQESVQFLGFISAEEMSMYYHHAAMTAFPSKLGYTNLPPLESLLSGTPVIVSDVHDFDFELPPKGYVKVSTVESALWADAIAEKLEEGVKGLELATATANILDAKLGSVDIKRLFNSVIMNIKG